MEIKIQVDLISYWRVIKLIIRFEILHAFEIPNSSIVLSSFTLKTGCTPGDYKTKREDKTRKSNENNKMYFNCIGVQPYTYSTKVAIGAAIFYIEA